MNRFLRLVRKGYRALAPGGGGSSLGYTNLANRSGLDYRHEVGAVIDNSVVYPIISFAVLRLLEARIKTFRPDSSGRMVEVPNHPITELLNQPVPWYGTQTLVSAWAIATMLGGNAYMFKHRSGAGKLVGLEYLPLRTCWPESLPGSGHFIDRYRLALPSGHQFGVDPEDILHLRWHTIDPWRPALGISPFVACYPEIAGDKRAARYETSMLIRGGKAHLLSPKGVDESGAPLTFGAAQREEFNTLMEEETTGDNVGTSLVVPYPMESVQIGFSPADMALEHQHNLTEERACACVQIPPIALNFGTGMQQTNNRASYGAAIQQAYFSFTRPTVQHLGRQLTEDLVPELGEPGDVVAWDLDEYPQERDYRAESDQRDCGGPSYTVNEVRGRRGDKPIDGGDVLRGGVPTSPDSDGKASAGRKPANDKDKDR